MDYKKLYEKVINYLAEEYGCAECPPEDTSQDKKCMNCHNQDADTIEKRKECWKKKFEN